MTASARFELRLIEDILVAGERFAFEDDDINRAVYLAYGGVVIDDKPLAADSMWHGKGGAKLVAGEHGAALWRWEIAPAEARAQSLSGNDSRRKLAAEFNGSAGAHAVMRGDSVAFPPGGCAYLHTHKGPGIRCLLEGGIRIDVHGKSRSYAPGGAWFEAGPDPVFAQADHHRPTRFIRVMVLPADMLGKSSISYVNPDDREKPKSQTYKGYLDHPITL